MTIIVLSDEWLDTIFSPFALTMQAMFLLCSAWRPRPREASGYGRGAVPGQGRRRVVQARDGQGQVQGRHPVHSLGKEKIRLEGRKEGRNGGRHK